MCLVHQPSISPAWSTFSGFAFRGSKEHPPALALRLRPGPRDGWVLILVPEFHDFKWQNQGFRWKKHIFSAIRSPASGFWLNLFQSGRFAVSGDSTDHRAGADGELDALHPSCIPISMTSQGATQNFPTT